MSFITPDPSNLTYDPYLGSTRMADNVIPQLDADPTSPVAQHAWVLKTTGGGTGGGKLKTALGFGGGGYMVTPSVGGSTIYQLSYRTLEGTTKRVTLS